jgi:ribosomal protein L29
VLYALDLVESGVSFKYSRVLSLKKVIARVKTVEQSNSVLAILAVL